MSEDRDSSAFDLSQGFDPGQVAGGLELGPYASHYQELFADALEDGVITAEERERLDKAADNLGMDRLKLNQLEQAMVRAYEAHNRVKVVEKWEAEPASLKPIDVEAAGDAARAMLLAQIERLQARIVELEEELREARSHINVEVDLSGIDDASTLDEPIDRLQSRVRRDPTNPRLFQSLFTACGQVGDRDGQYRAAQALCVLGAADEEQRKLVEQHEPEALISPQRSLTQDGWHQDLHHAELEVVTSNILSLVTPAALVGRAASLRREKKLPQLDDDQKHDPSGSTVAAVRALGWSATVLGMPAPVIYVDATRDVAYAHVPAMPPWSLLGKAVLSGRKPKEQAFLAGRHMTYYRAEFFAKVLFPAVPELENLFLAALLLGSPSLPIAAHLKTRVRPLADSLAPLLDAPKLDALRQQFKAFVADGGRTNLLRWSESADKTAARAGLLICGDLRTAAALLEAEEGARGPLLTDLLAFSVSARYHNLRKQLGIALEA